MDYSEHFSFFVDSESFLQEKGKLLSVNSIFKQNSESFNRNVWFTWPWDLQSPCSPQKPRTTHFYTPKFEVFISCMIPDV